METCISDVRDWMRSMYLKMNDSKTEYLLIGTKQQLAKCSSSQLVVGDSIVSPPKYVRDLGVYLDSCLTMEQHVKLKCKAAYAQLHNISQIRKYVDRKTAETLIHGLVHSQLDYCNALLAGLPKVLIHKLQMVQNSAARVLCRIPMQA